MSAPIFRLPPEILFQVLSSLDPIDVSSFSQTCHTLSSYCSPATNFHLWTTLFLNLFDAENAGEDHTDLLKRRVRARGLINMAREKNQLERIVSAYEPVLDVFVGIAVGARVDAEEHSKNIDFLMELFPPDTSAFTEEYLASYTSRHSSLTSPSTLQSLAHFRLLHGRTWRIFEPYHRLAALTKVYQVANFTNSGRAFGPILQNSDINEVDYELVDCIKRVMEYNIGTAISTEGWGNNIVTGFQTNLPCLEGWKSTAVGKTEKRDWAGVEKSWVGSYSFLDWEVFALLNSDNADSLLSLSTTTQLESLAEAIGDCMTLTLKLVESPSVDPNPSSSTSYPPLSFAGSLGPSTRSPNQPTLNISGRVYMDAQKVVRWSYQVCYANQVQWALEGVQVGGMGSKAGVVGVWTHASRLINGFPGQEVGPCGPFWWWPADE